MANERQQREIVGTIKTDPDTGVIFDEEHSIVSYDAKGRMDRFGFHKKDGPAIVSRDRATGEVLWEAHFLNGLLTRLDGPASFKRDPKSKVITEEIYSVDGRFHRTDGPAKIDRDPNSGRVTSEEYMINGEYHREDGPSFILFDYRTGALLREDYFLRGKELSREEFMLHPSRASRSRPEFERRAAEAPSSPTASRRPGLPSPPPRHSSRPLKNPPASADNRVRT